jgi:mannitol-specific phosphotransferase system IIBC component
VDESLAYRLGLLLAATGTADIVDAQGALLGASLSALVISSDPEELRRLDKSLNIVEV